MALKMDSRVAGVLLNCCNGCGNVDSLFGFKTTLELASNVYGMTASPPTQSKTLPPDLF